MSKTRSELKQLEEKLGKRRDGLLILCGMIIFVSVTWYFGPSTLAWIKGVQGESQSHGTLGDSFGSINALFAGLAFAGLVWSLMQTNLELRLQKEIVLLQIHDQIEARGLLADQSSAQQNLAWQVKRLNESTSASMRVNALIALAESVEREADACIRYKELAKNEAHLEELAAHRKSCLSKLQWFQQQIVLQCGLGIDMPSKK